MTDENIQKQQHIIDTPYVTTAERKRLFTLELVKRLTTHSNSYIGTVEACDEHIKNAIQIAYCC